MPQSCVKAVTPGSCAQGGSAGGLWNVVISPNGRSAYGLAWDSHAILVFDRNPASGRLTQRQGAAGCVAQGGANGCATAHGIVNPDNLVISPDGRFAYVGGWGGAVATFSRNPTTGALAYVECVNDDGSGNCANGRGLAGARRVLLSPDGAHLYAGPHTSIASFARDAATGKLTQLDGTAACIQETNTDGCVDATGLGADGLQFAISPDGKSVYVAGNTSLATLDRGTDGALSQRPGKSSCVAVDGLGDQCSRDPRLTGAHAVLAGPEGRQVYVSTNDGLLVYSRAANGQLTIQSCLNDAGAAGCAAGRHVRSLSYLALSPDGRDLVAHITGGLPGYSFLSRDAAGNLSQRTAGADVCLSPDGRAFDNNAFVPDACWKDSSIGADGQIAFADDSFVYFGGYYTGGSISVVKRDFYPTCRDQSVATAHNTSVLIAFGCRDRNGDKLTYAVTTAPGAGQLGAIDQPRGRVHYNPFGGFAGRDSFRLTATANNLTSRPAAISVTVARGSDPVSTGTPTTGASPVAPPAGVDNDRDGFFAGQDCNDASASIRPGAAETRGNNLDENCDGTAEPFPTLTSGVVTRWSARGSALTLTVLQVTQQFPRGWKAQIRCSGPRCPFRAKALKAGKVRRGAATISSSLTTKQRRFRAGQTVEVWVSAPGFNTKVARFVLKKGRIPTTQPFCAIPGQSRPQKTCS